MNASCLVVADSAEDHGEDFVAGDLAGGLEGTVGIALDQLSVGAVADVALSPTGASHVAESAESRQNRSIRWNRIPLGFSPFLVFQRFAGQSW